LHKLIFEVQFFQISFIFRPTDPHSGVQDLAGVPFLLSGVQKQKNIVSKVVGALADR
jgi:hypothetical protein